MIGREEEDSKPRAETLSNAKPRMKSLSRLSVNRTEGVKEPVALYSLVGRISSGLSYFAKGVVSNISVQSGVQEGRTLLGRRSGLISLNFDQESMERTVSWQCPRIFKFLSDLIKAYANLTYALSTEIE